MSDDYLPMLIAKMQQDIAQLSERVEALEMGQDDEDAPATYMDGTPVR